MLSNLLSKFRYVRQIERHLSAAEQHCVVLQASAKESSAMVESLLSKLDDAEAQNSALAHRLEVETSKRIAAEQISVARGGQIEWLGRELDKAQQARDNAVSERAHSLDLVNLTLLRQAEAEAPPTKEQMAEWRPVPKQKQQAVPLMRKAQDLFIRGLRDQVKKRSATQPEAKVM